MRQTQSVLPSMSDILCIFSFTLTPVDPYSSPSPRVNRGAHILHKREWRHREVKGITQPGQVLANAGPEPRSTFSS